MNGRERVLNMIEGRPVDSLPLMPITMMFAASQIGEKYGRYATDHRVLAEAQLRTAESFDFDYVSTISDPGREAADCGAQVRFFEDQPPALEESQALLAGKATLTRLKMPDPLGGGRMHDRIQGIDLLKRRVGRDKIVEGWLEGACAEAADLRGINTLMMDFYDDPDFVRDLFEFTTELGLRFGRAQLEAGADLIGIGDSASSLVGPRFYEEYVFPCHKRVVDGLHQAGGRVRLHICGNTRPLFRLMGALNCEIVDLDSMAPVDEARREMGPDQVLLGNIDPVKVLRDRSPEEVTRAIAECHRQGGDRYIVGAGCEVTRDTPAENLRALTRYARRPLD
jgi:MtaA/CmuA family methyltransferase